MRGIESRSHAAHIVPGQFETRTRSLPGVDNGKWNWRSETADNSPSSEIGNIESTSIVGNGGVSLFKEGYEALNNFGIVMVARGSFPVSHGLINSPCIDSFMSHPLGRSTDDMPTICI